MCRTKFETLRAWSCAIINIGYCLNPEVPHMKEIMDSVEYEEPPEGEDGSKYDVFFALTSTGEPVGLAEYTADVASAGWRVHAVCVHDWDKF